MISYSLNRWLVLGSILIQTAQLGWHGGMGPMHALLECSPALEAADDSASPGFDQRGEARPVGAHNDMGAFEGSVPGCLRIISAPTNRSVLAGSTTTLMVMVDSTLPASYQWLTNGGPLLGYTNATVILRNLQVEQSGSYSVLVSNALAWTLSAPAYVEVGSPTNAGTSLMPVGTK